MIRKLFLLLILYLPLFASDESIPFSEVNKPVTIKVLLTKLAKDAILEIKGPYLIYDPQTNSLISKEVKNKRSKIQTSDNGIVWGKAMLGYFAIQIVPNDVHTEILLNKKAYPGCLEIYSIGGTLNILNEVSAETYLKSIQTSRFASNINPTVLDAVTIIERTNLYSLVNKNSFASWQVEAKNVGYLGISPIQQNQPLANAIERTRGMVLQYKKKPFACSFAFDHAGTSSSHSSIFRKGGKTPQGVQSLPSSHSKEATKWTRIFTKKELAKLLDFSSIVDMNLFFAKPSSKVYAIRLVGKHEHKDIPFFTFQRLLGKNALSSNDFTVTFQGKKAVFTGYGKGAGVGLCLKSACILAKRGISVENILTQHFPGTELVNLEREAATAPISYIWK